MSRHPPVLASLTALILAFPVLAVASSFPELAACEERLARAPGQEEPARCLYELATGSGPWRAAATGRLRQAIERHPENPWFLIYLGKAMQSGGLEEAKAAEELFTLGARLAVRRGMKEAEFNARWGLCRILRNTGRLEEGAAEMERAVAAARASRLPLLRLRSEILRSLHWNAEGEYERAYVALSGIRAEVEARKSYPLLREYLVALCQATPETGRFQEALQAFRQLAESALAAGDPQRVAQARWGMASLRFYESVEVPSADGRKEVLELARIALSAARASGTPSMEMEPLWMLGLLEEDGTRAREHLERCFEVAANPGQRSWCRSALARRLAGTDPRKARAAIQEALELARKSGKVQDQTAAWSNHMRVSWQINAPQTAMEDARTALDSIEALRNQQRGGYGQPGLFSTWAEHYYWLSGQLLRTGQTERAFEVIERMRSRTLIDTLGLAPAPGAAVRFASLAEVRAALAPDEALLSFQVAPWEDLAGEFGGGSWLLVSTRHGTRLHRLPEDRSWVRSAVNTFTGMFAARNGSEAPTAATLYTKILGPALAELPPEVRRLVIVADDSLHRLPFSILRPEPGSGPLAVRYAIALAPSATLWLHWREARPAPAVTPALVLADPVPLARRKPLRYARAEGKAVKRHLGAGELLVGEEASEAYVKKNGDGAFGLLHFAAHAVTDEINPERSAIHLSPGGEEDGELEVREIADLGLDGRIVVLSTCESASGEILRGEGVMGLARAFFQAGAHTVVASLWPLRDDDGAALFERFYRHLGRGKNVAAALQAAQRDRMAGGAPAEAWAGVVVLGDGDRIPVPGGRGPGLVWWALALIALLALAYAARRARQRRRTSA